VKILVPLKRVPDPALKTTIKDGKIDLSNATWVVNTFDEYAVETALRLVENAETGERIDDGEVVVVTIGPEDAAAELRKGLAMGADRAILIDGSDDKLDSGVVAATLARVYEEEKPDLVCMGKQAVDGDSNQVAQRLAGLLGLPQATFAASVEVDADRKSLTVGREVDAGVEYKTLPLPGVLTVDLRIVAPDAVKNGVTPESHKYQADARYASLKGIMKAKKKPMDKKSLADYGVTAPPVLTELSVELPPPRIAGVVVESVEELVAKLRDEAKVI
jgi:electron transfer flavoprotein beta subunit